MKILWPHRAVQTTPQKMDPKDSECEVIVVLFPRVLYLKAQWRSVSQLIEDLRGIENGNFIDDDGTARAELGESATNDTLTARIGHTEKEDEIGDEDKFKSIDIIDTGTKWKG